MASVLLATGTRVTITTGAPTVQDMAISLSRIPRFSGNGWNWFPVALHSYIVADLLPDHLKAYGLIHDGPECAGNDVPKPFKTRWTKKFETGMMRRTLESLGLPPVSPYNAKLIKAADIASLNAEAWTVGPPGSHKVHDFRERYRFAETLVKFYLRKYPPITCIRRHGACPREFVRRFNLYRPLADGTIVR